MTTKPRFNWRHQYDDARDKQEGDASTIRCEDPSLTVQAFAEDADLNVIAKRFGIDNMPIGTPDPSHYRDTTQDPELRDILDLQRHAEEAFRSLPLKLRKRFHNNRDELWQFLNDPENAEEAVRLGLLSRTTSSAGADARAPHGPDTASSTTTPTGNQPSGGTEGPPAPPPKDSPSQGGASK